MLNFLLAILTLSLLQSCKKDNEDLISPKDDDAVFLNSSQYTFRGKLSDSSILWRYGVSEFQRGNMSNPVGSNPQIQKSLTFWLTSNKDLTTRFEITTPGYYEGSDELFSTVLAPGEKQIGGAYQKFELQLTLNNKVYTTNGDQKTSVLKVLKVAESKDESNKDVVLAWFKVNCKFYSIVDTTSFSLEDGYILAGFYE